MPIPQKGPSRRLRQQYRSALSDVAPAGFDLCSGIRVEGLLDDAKMGAFFEALRRACISLALKQGVIEYRGDVDGYRAFIASNILDEQYVISAEELGYSHAWFADSQMLWSDCYATLALAAKNTSTIRLGTGSQSLAQGPHLSRHQALQRSMRLPQDEHSQAWVQNTAMRVMGLPPSESKHSTSMWEYQLLLRGDEALYQQALVTGLFSTSCRIMGLFRLRRRFRCMCLGLGRSLLRWLDGKEMGPCLAYRPRCHDGKYLGDACIRERPTRSREVLYDCADRDWGVDAW